MKFLAISTNLADPTPHIPAEIARTTELMKAACSSRHCSRPTGPGRCWSSTFPTPPPRRPRSTASLSSGMA